MSWGDDQVQGRCHQMPWGRDTESARGVAPGAAGLSLSPSSVHCLCCCVTRRGLFPLRDSCPRRGDSALDRPPPARPQCHAFTSILHPHLLPPLRPSPRAAATRARRVPLCVPVTVWDCPRGGGHPPPGQLLLVLTCPCCPLGAGVILRCPAGTAARSGQWLSGGCLSWLLRGAGSWSG